jgi:putative transposase
MQEPSKAPQRRLHRLPKSVYSATEYEFYFTVCARHQGTPFTNRTLADKVIDSLLWTKTKYLWLLYCYCLMPDHLHFVCRLTEREVKLMNAGARGIVAEGVIDHLARFKSFTTNVSWKLGYRGALWQKSSYDRVLDMMKPFEEVAFYVLENPIRRGLAQNWEDWPYSRIVDPWW